MKFMRPPLMWACMAAVAVGLWGCASRQVRAERLTVRMLDPGVSLKEALILRQKLRRLTPESEPYLESAFFPIGLYDVPESALEEIAAAGFNLVVNGGKDESYLDRAEALGLKVIPYINTENMAPDVERMAGRRSILAWYLWDEPDLHKLAPKKYHSLAKRLRKLDKSRPIYLTVWSPKRYADFMRSCDVFAPNPYPIRSKEPAKNNLEAVSYVVDAARKQAGWRPVWAIVQAFWAEPIWMRNPTPEELRAMVFLAINHGADGVTYFSYKSGDRPITEHVELFAEIKRINRLLLSLRGRLLVEPYLRGTISLNISPEGVTPYQFRVDISLRSFQGETLLIAVNPLPAPQELLSLPAGPSAEGQAGDWRTILGNALPEVPPGAIDLVRFGPYEVKVFRIKGTDITKVLLE